MAQAPTVARKPQLGPETTCVNLGQGIYQSPKKGPASAK